MRITRVLAVLTISAAMAAFISASAPAADAASEKRVQAKDTGQIVAGIIKAYGGEAAIKAAKGVYVKGAIKATMRDDNGTYERYVERPRKLRVNIVYRKSSELRILNGADGWRGEDKGSLAKVDGFQYTSMLYQYKQLELPYDIMMDRYDVKWVGEALVGGKRADILSLRDKEGPPMDIYVDAGSRLIVKCTGWFDMGGDKIADLTAEFSDYRNMSGTMVPFSINNYSQGYLIGETTITECKVNPPMKGTLFRP